jgi:hypothetical protein
MPDPFLMDRCSSAYDPLLFSGCMERVSLIDVNPEDVVLCVQDMIEILPFLFTESTYYGARCSSESRGHAHGDQCRWQWHLALGITHNGEKPPGS